MLGAALGLRALGKDVADVPRRRRRRFPAEYGFMPLGEVLREPPADVGERVLLAVDCANERRIAPRARRPRRRRRSSSTSTTITTTRASAPSIWSSPTPRRPPRSSRPARRARRRRSRPRSPRRSTSASSPTPGASSTRTRPRRRCGSPPTSSRPARTCTSIFRHVYETVQFAKLKLLARALEHARALRGRAARRLVPAALRLRRGRRGGAVLRGDHRLPARDRGRRSSWR